MDQAAWRSKQVQVLLYMSLILFIMWVEILRKAPSFYSVENVGEKENILQFLEGNQKGSVCLRDSHPYRWQI